MNITQLELKDMLIKDMNTLKNFRKRVEAIKLSLSESNGFSVGDVQMWFMNPEKYVPELDTLELICLTSAIHEELKTDELNPNNFFNENQIKKAKLHEADLFHQDKLNLPYSFEYARKVGRDAYSVNISAKEINQFLDAQLLNYDFELQREAKERIVNGEIEKTATIVMKNVNEIANHLIDNTLEPTMLVWNALQGSSDIGEEIIYDPQTLKLTITKGTELAIVDGMHRIKGVEKAILRNPELEFNFTLQILNYNKKKAQQYQAQLAEATAISSHRKKALKQERYSDVIVERLMLESDLKGRISQRAGFARNETQLTNYTILSDAIDVNFKINTKKEATLIADYLIRFFDELIGLDESAFVTYVAETRNESLINDPKIFAGYIALASRMYRENMDVENLDRILSQINFSRNEPNWKVIKVLKENGNLEDDRIAKYRALFTNLPLINKG